MTTAPICTPECCEFSEPWGSTVCHGTKNRCCKPPANIPGWKGSRPWRYSTTYGGRCVCHDDKPEQLSMFDHEDEDPDDEGEDNE